jgi:hypothetical protein
MKLSLKTVQDLAKSPKGRKLLEQAKTYDTPENREKAKDLLRRVRGTKKRGSA